MVAVFLALFLIVKTFSEMKEFRYIGSGVYPQNVISVTGKGEVFIVPDIATFSFTIREERPTPAEAQQQATERMNVLLAELKEFGVEETDIKTIAYNLSPRYQFPRVGFGERVLAGYELSQIVSLKVRDISRAGEVLSKVGQANVSNISSLNFSVDDEEAARREARKMAIDEAQQKAETLSKDLSVRLVRIVNFSESGDFYPYGMGMGGDFALESSVKSAPGFPAPEIPVGENKIVSQVYITYEIR